MIKNSRFAKVAVSAGLIVASGAAVLGITSFASAKVASQRSATVQVVEETSDSTASGSMTQDNVQSGSASTQSADQARPPRANPISVAAKALGMSESDLVAELTAGKSIAEVAKAKDVDIDTVIAALTADFKAHLDAEVKSGEHTQDEADAKLAEFKTRVTEMVNTKGLPAAKGDHGPGKGGHGDKGDMGRHGAPFATENLAKVLKLTTDELNTKLRSGSSLADIAKAQNVDIADVKDVLTSDFKAHLDAEVKSGEHTQDEADTKLAEFTTRLDDMVNGVRPARGPGMGGHRGHGGHDFGQPPAAQQGTDAQAESTSFSA